MAERPGLATQLQPLMADHPTTVAGVLWQPPVMRKKTFSISISRKLMRSISSTQVRALWINVDDCLLRRDMPSAWTSQGIPQSDRKVTGSKSVVHFFAKSMADYSPGPGLQVSALAPAWLCYPGSGGTMPAGRTAIPHPVSQNCTLIGLWLRGAMLAFWIWLRPLPSSLVWLFWQCRSSKTCMLSTCDPRPVKSRSPPRAVLNRHAPTVFRIFIALTSMSSKMMGGNSGWTSR